MSRISKEKLTARQKRTEKRTACRKITRAINARFATIIINGTRWNATEKEKLAANIALIHLKNREQKDIEKHHTKLAPDLKRTRKAKAQREAISL